jgi:hypothetical protein
MALSPPVPPAVIALLAGRPSRDGLQATLLDLAARGWFRLRQPGILIGGDAMELAGPVMCVLPASPPDGDLLAYEQRAMAYLTRRAGVRGETPADGLMRELSGGFLRAFGREVAADARSRGLLRAGLGRGHTTPAGQAALAVWRASMPVSPAAGIGREVAYAAALGAAPLALFGDRRACRRERPRGFSLALACLPRACLPRAALRRARRGRDEFDGQVLRQWEVARADGVVHYVAIDDGVRARTFPIASDLFETLIPGALVHAQVDPRRNELLDIRPLRPADDAA